MTHTRKLSASALSAFLKSPRNYYYGYVARLEPLSPSVATWDHDKLAGSLWSGFVDRFYKGASESSNTQALMASWHEQTDGWVPEKVKDKLTKALETWAAGYYQQFSPDDGARNGSELHLENDRFVAYLDGLSHERIVHEVKSTSRSPNLTEQLEKVSRSIQVKLYCVMADAIGYRIEFAWKNQPYDIFRAPVVDVSTEQKAEWSQQLNALADTIYALGDDPNNYVCHPDGCTIITQHFVGSCQYQALCTMGLNEMTSIAYKSREHRK